MNNYSVLWSGGFDSTYMIQHILESDVKNSVTCGYLEILNNEPKTKKELEAIDKLKEIFKNKYGTRFEYVGVIMSVNVNKHDTSIYCPQLLFLLTALSHLSNKNDYASCLGFVMNDNSISFLSEIKNIWKNISNLRMEDLPELMFPLSKYPKWGINSNLNESIKELCVCCEESTEDKFCHKCDPCKRNLEAGLIPSKVEDVERDLKKNKKTPSFIGWGF